MISYSNIYATFLQKIHDITLANDLNINTEIATDRMFGYLKSSITNFNVCVQDLTDRIDPHVITEFNGDGVTTIFILPITPTIESGFTVNVNNVAVSNYTYNSTTNSITFLIAPIIGIDNISIQWSFLGQFNVDLTDLEQEILAMYMVYEWVSPFINDILQFKNYLQSNDFKTFSGAAFLSAKMSLQNQLKDMSDDLMCKYSYDQTDYSDFN